MAEKSEAEASKSGQDVETPETEQSRTETGPAQDSATAGQVGAYRESEGHVPDPTAITGTLETSGTGGGVHERLTGTTRIFGDVEHIAQRLDTLIHEHTQALKEEVRGMLIQHEASAQAAQIPQQSVEHHGLATHQGNIVAPHNDTGAAQDAPRSANVAGSPEDVSAGITPVEEPAQDSYQQTTIAGAGDPQEPVRKAEQAEAEGASEPKESEDDKGQQSTLGKNISAAAKKTAARRQAAASKQQDKK
jgi:hypothetical protein